MQRLVLAICMLCTVGSFAAMAQTGPNNGLLGSGVPDSTAASGAPVGHRQPRSGGVPSEKNLSDPNSAANKADARLDRKIKSICKGC